MQEETVGEVSDIVKEEANSNVKNRQILREEADLTPKIVHERKQKEKIVKRVAKFGIQGSARPLLIHGPVASGKTAMTKYYVKQTKNYLQQNDDCSNTFKREYIDCNRSSTPYQIMKSLTGQTSRDVGTLYKEWKQQLIESEDEDDQKTILILDEIDKIQKSDQLNRLLHYLSREIKSKHCLVILLTRDLKTFEDKLDQDTRSSLGHERLMMTRYDTRDIIDILEKRASEAFYEWEKKQIKYIAGFTSKKHNSDVRVAIRSLEQCFESKPFPKDNDELGDIVEQSKANKQRHILEGLSEEHIWIAWKTYEEEIERKKLYKYFKTTFESDMSYPTFRNRVATLQRNNLVRNETVMKRNTSKATIQSKLTKLSMEKAETLLQQSPYAHNIDV